MNRESVLDRVASPADLQGLNGAELSRLCEEIRAEMIKTVSRMGGHLSSNLGVVELTVALHRVFDFKKDRLVFDVGHQCYPHKLLTGRREAFSTLRAKDGISGFPKTGESPYDCFIAGHASTSVSAAYGMARAFALQGDPSYAVALVGDGGMTGGEVYEALNNAGRSDCNLIVVLNHNSMSISKTVGGLARHLSNIRTRPGYIRAKRQAGQALRRVPLIGEPIRKGIARFKSFLRLALYRSTFFEELGFRFLGPVDGHDLAKLEQALRAAKALDEPVVLQVETVKGKGYPYAEENPGAYHAIGRFDVLNGGDDVTGRDCYSNSVGEVLVRLAKDDPRICAITAAMKYGTGLQHFAAMYRDRFFDVGIAEPHAVTFAGGLAAGGMLPVFCVYSTFLQRGYDQLLHDLAIDRQHVVLCVDRAGLVGEDGETHQGVFDVAFLSGIPGVAVYAPDGYAETELCLREALFRETGVAAVRYPRGKEEKSYGLPASIEPQWMGETGEILFVTYGRETSQCALAREILAEDGISADLLKLTRLAPDPVPEQVLKRLLSYRFIVFAEEGIRRGGIGEQLGTVLMQNRFSGEYLVIAIDDFVPQAQVFESLQQLGLDAASLRQTVKEWKLGR